MKRSILTTTLLLFGFVITYAANSVSLDDSTCDSQECCNNSTYIYGNFAYKEDGKTLAYITLTQQGTVVLHNDVDGIHVTGTYEIEGDVNYYGGTHYIYFHIDGETYCGKIFFPTDGKWMIVFDGLAFILSRN